MIKIMKQNDNVTTYLTEFLADSEADLAELPKDVKYAGSTCLVAETGNVYILNNKEEWVLL